MFRRPPWIVHERTIGAVQEVLKSKVDADRIKDRSLIRRWSYLTGDSSSPFQPGTDNYTVTWSSFDISMAPESQPHARNEQYIAVNSTLNAETVISFLGSPTGKTWSLALLASSKESVERSSYPAQRIAGDMTRYRGSFRIESS
jgi:hypothetical protein